MQTRAFTKLLICLCVLCILPVSARADAESTSGALGTNLTWVFDADGTLTISGTGPMPELNWSDTPWDRTQVQHIVIAPGVTTLSNYAFYRCEALTSVTLPATLTEIGSSAFAGCSTLAHIDLPDSITEIGEHAFRETGLTQISLPNHIAHISGYCFYACVFLTQIDMPAVTEIDYCAWKDCVSLQTITLPAMLEEIDTSAFQGCTSLSSIDIAPANTHYRAQDGVLFSADGQILCLYPEGRTDERYTIPDGVTELAYEAFQNNTHLQSVTMPDSVTELQSYVFSGCTSLSYVRLSKQLEKLPYCCFQGCSALSSIDPF